MDLGRADLVAALRHPIPPVAMVGRVYDDSDSNANDDDDDDNHEDNGVFVS